MINSGKVPIILASKSPRRREILTEMGLEFTVKTKDVEESFPLNLTPDQVAVFIAEKKAKAFIGELRSEILIAADTIVSLDNQIIGKPKSEQDAFEILSSLSGKVHQVITAVSFLQEDHLASFYDVSEVHFRPLTEQEVHHYIQTYRPFDKAGAYGIQEWIGYIGIDKIVGSYTTVMGLPSAMVYSELRDRLAI